MITFRIMGSFSISEAATLSGLTPMMVDYLCRQEIVVPSFPRKRSRGKRRRYNFGEVVLLRTVGKLLKRGVSVKRLKQALRSRNRYFREMDADKPPIHLFVTNGKEIFIKDPNSNLMNLTQNGQFEFSFVVDLRTTHAEVVTDLDKVRKQREAARRNPDSPPADAGKPAVLKA